MTAGESAGPDAVRTDVLIVGAGPTGLTLAVDLARRGIDAVVVEQAPELPRQSRGKGLQPRTLEILDDLGVVDQVLARGERRQLITLYKDRRRLARFEAGVAEPRADVPYPNIVMLPQYATTGILAERLAELGGTILSGTRLDRLEVKSGGASGELIGADGKRREFGARYLVGCDGGRSFVRKAVGASFEGETREAQRYLLGDEPSLEKLRQLWEQRTGHSGLLLTDPTWLSNFQVNIRRVDSYRHGLPPAVDRLSGGRVRAGDRASDAEVVEAATNRRCRLFDVFRGPHFTLLLYEWRGGIEQEVLGDNVHGCLVADRESPGWSGVAVRDSDGSFRHSYRLKPGTALLVRPDGYVAWRARYPTLSELRSALHACGARLSE